MHRFGLGFGTPAPEPGNQPQPPAQPTGARATEASFGGGSNSLTERMRALRLSMITANRGVASVMPERLRNVRPSPLAPVRADVIERGPADNRDMFERCCAGDGGLLPSILRRVNIAPFTDEVITNFRLDMRGFLVAHMICALRVPRVPQQKQLLILETMAPYIPVDLVLDPVQSAREVNAVLRNYAAIRDNGWIQDMMQAAAAAHPGVDGGHWVRRFVRDADHYGWVDNVTTEQMLDYLYRLTEYIAERQEGRSLGVIITLVASFALRGSITNTKLTRIITDLSPIISYAGDALNLSDLQLTWATFGHFVDDATMPGIMRRWLSFIPAATIRLRVVLSQAAGSGMTGLDVIARAIHEHPQFPWPLVRRMYPNEWEAAERALLLVGENPYYGYRRDLTEVRSTLFKYFSALCGRLLIAAGDKSLDGYRGFAEDKTNKESITRMIEAYMASHADVDFETPLSGDENGHYRVIRDIVARHPANLQNLARMGGHDDLPNDQRRLARRNVDGYQHLRDRLPRNEEGEIEDSSDDDSDDNGGPDEDGNNADRRVGGPDPGEGAPAAPGDGGE